MDTMRFLKTKLAFAMVILSVTWLAPRALADGLNTSVTVNFNTGIGCSQSNSTPTGPSESSCTATTSDIGNDLTAAGAALAFAGYGLLGASTASTALCSVGCSSWGSSALANASFGDSLTFTNLNQPATLVETVSLTGVDTGSESCVGIAGFEGESICTGATIAFTSQLTPSFGTTESCRLSASSQCTVSVPIFDATEVLINGNVSVQTEVDVDSSLGGGGISSADYFDTAKVDSLSIVDANGNPIQGASIISASGTDYNSIMETRVPEPSSLLLFSAGLLGLLALKLRGA